MRTAFTIVHVNQRKPFSDPVSTISLRTVDTALFAGRIASRVDVLRGSSSAPVPLSEATGRKVRVRKIT